MGIDFSKVFSFFLGGQIKKSLCVETNHNEGISLLTEFGFEGEKREFLVQCVHKELLS